LFPRLPWSTFGTSWESFQLHTSVGGVVGTHGDMPVLCHETSWYFRTVTRNTLIWLSQERRHALTESVRWPSKNISVKCYDAQSLLGLGGKATSLVVRQEKRSQVRANAEWTPTNFEAYKTKIFQTFIWGTLSDS